MSEENPDIEEVLEEFRSVAQQFDEVLRDLEWRKPDVEGEVKKLEDLKKQAKKDPTVDVGTQAIVVRVLSAVLADKIAEAERLEKRMLQLKDQLEELERAEKKPGEGEAPGEAVHKEEKPLG